jgi:DNA-binding FadR family transcriptional regulator
MVKVFNSLQRQNLSEQFVQQIALSIMRNDFKPGDALASLLRFIFGFLVALFM